MARSSECEEVGPAAESWKNIRGKVGMKINWMFLLLVPAVSFAGIPRHCRSPQLLAQAKASIPRILGYGEGGPKVVSITVNYDGHRIKNRKHGYWIACLLNINWDRSITPKRSSRLMMGQVFVEWYNRKGTLMTGLASPGIPLAPWGERPVFGEKVPFNQVVAVHPAAIH